MHQPQEDLTLSNGIRSRRVADGRVQVLRRRVPRRLRPTAARAAAAPQDQTGRPRR